MSSVARSIHTQARPIRQAQLHIDGQLLTAALFLVCIGLVMVCSASITIADRQFDAPFHYFIRQAIYVGVGIGAGIFAATISLEHWERFSPLLLLVGGVLLVLVLIPGIGREVNGSNRWIGLGFMNLQPSELAKLFVILYLAGYLVRRGDEVRSSVKGFLKPMGILAVLSLLLLAEPDFGSTAVMVSTAMLMMFLAGVRLSQFGALILVVVAALGLIAVLEPYRLLRLTSFMDPWADPFNSGFQLTQALIAFGRGEWLGVGLGGSIQKLFYLPEAHTDFVFAVLAEELGLLGASAVIMLFGWMVWRAFIIGRQAMRCGKPFAAYLAFGLGFWIGLQAFVNIGVNMGVLPTKGLTLPLMSYGGSSIVVMCVAVALLLRIYHETKMAVPVERRKRVRS